MSHTRQPNGQQMTEQTVFAEKLSELGRLHSNAVGRLQAENNRLIEELRSLKPQFQPQVPQTEDSTASLIFLPGMVDENDSAPKLGDVQPSSQQTDVDNDDDDEFATLAREVSLSKFTKGGSTKTKEVKMSPDSQEVGQTTKVNNGLSASFLTNSQVTAKKRSLFPDAEDLKMQVREAVAGKPVYNVHDKYWDTGICQAIARSNTFENITFLVIFAVTAWIAVDTDLNDAAMLLDAKPIFIIGANAFCAYFTFELAVRFGAFRTKKDCLKDFSFLFDGILVFQDVLETWVLTIYFAAADSKSGSPAKFGIFRVLRMAKLIRMGRAVRLMRTLPEIAILIKGIGIATRSVFFTLVLLMIVVYVFAVVFRQLTKDTDIGEQYFPSVFTSMNSLLLDGVLPDNAAIVNDLAGQDWYLWPIIMFFILLASLTIMNMLVGVLVEVIGAVAAAEKEGVAVGEMREHLINVMSKLDCDLNGYISKKEFDKLLVEPEAAKILENVGVDVVGLVDISEIIFEDFGSDGELDLEDFMSVVLDLRTSNTAKVKDVVLLQKLMKRDMIRFWDSAMKSMNNMMCKQFTAKVEKPKEEVKAKTSGDKKAWEETGQRKFSEASTLSVPVELNGST